MSKPLGKPDRIVVALGGNALGNTPEEQIEKVGHAAHALLGLIEQGNEIIITHGNGPQVGMIQNAFAAAHDAIGTPAMDLPECGAMSQGYIGYQLSQAILNDLKSRDIMRSTACIVTQTVVDADDPAFQNPTKPVGAFMDEETAKAKAEAMGITVKEDAGRGWRQVVASPIPKRIVEFDAVRDLVEDGYVVVSTGGGGVPVFETENGYVGTPAVIDKDRSSALMAAELGADMLIILTAVEKVAINFGKPDQKWLDHLTPEEARQYEAEGQFAPGSMLPKVQAAVKFAASKPGRTALITLLEKAKDGIAGKTGTAVSM